MTVGACVASTLEKMKWNDQGKSITYRAFHRCVEKFKTRFRMDGHAIKRGELVYILVILCYLIDLTLYTC
jgi:hypothetical protein